VLIRILGPLEVDGQPVRSRVERVVLSWAVLQGGHRVRFDRCGRAVYPAVPTLTATRRVRTAARALADRFPDIVTVERDQLKLLAGRDDVDAWIFRRTLSETTAASDPGQLAAALALWRGQPYPDLAGVPAAASAIDQLTELHLSATEARFAMDLREGVDYRLIARLTAAVARYPTREWLWRQLVVALFAASRQAEALQRIDECRRTLLGYGRPTSSALHQLQLAILRGDGAAVQAGA
jgi:DNA-binding SARP family transcriptional activator